MNKQKSNRFYLQQAHRYFRQAKHYYNSGDLQQASEKLWGCAASAIKAVAEKKGWEHNGHRQLFRIVQKLSSQSKDKEIIRLFHTANSLHTNFYEGWMQKEHVEVGYQEVAALLQRLETLISKVAEK